MDEVLLLLNQLKELNDYVKMLVEGDYDKEYIVGKVEHHAKNIIHDAGHAYDYAVRVKGESND